MGPCLPPGIRKQTISKTIFIMLLLIQGLIDLDLNYYFPSKYHMSFGFDFTETH